MQPSDDRHVPSVRETKRSHVVLFPVEGEQRYDSTTPPAMDDDMMHDALLISHHLLHPERQPVVILVRNLET